MKIIYLCVLLAIMANAFAEPISSARWIYAPPAERPPEKGFLRTHLKVGNGVKRAYFYTFLEGPGTGVWLNGQRLNLQEWKPLRRFRGHVKGVGTDIANQLKAGDNVLAFRLENHDAHYGMILRGEIEYEDGRRQEFHSDATGYKATSEEWPGWETVAFDDSGWEAAFEVGDVLTRPWSTYGDVAEIYCTPAEFARYRERETLGFPERRLLSEPDNPRVRLSWEGDVLGVEVAGVVLPPISMSCVGIPQTPADAPMLKSAHQIGIPFLCCSIGDRFRNGDDEFSLTEVDLAIRKILAVHPDAYLVIDYRPDSNWQRRWVCAHPDDAVGFALTTKIGPAYFYHVNSIVASFASEAFREEVCKFVRIFSDYAARQPWGRRIAALQIRYGGSGDGMPYGAHCMPDTGKRMTEAFRRYLGRKYPTDAALQSAWGDDRVMRATAEVPNRDERRGSDLYIRDLSDPRDRRVADYYDCYHREFNDFILSFTRAVKTHFPGRLAGAYYGYYILGYSPEGNTARIKDLLASQDIDYMYCTTKGYNLTDGLPRHLHSLFRRNRKMSSIEADIRAHTGRGEADRRWLCKTPEETRATIQKVIGNAMINGCGFHLADFGRKYKWFDCPEILEPISTALAEWKRMRESPPIATSDVAVVVDQDQVWRQGHPDVERTSPFAENLLSFPLQTIGFSGYPYDLYAPEDFLNAKDYRAVVLLNLFETPSQLRSALKEKLRRKGVTAIWSYAPGISTPNGYSADTMLDLTGMRLYVDRTPRVFDAKFTDGSPLALFAMRGARKESPRIAVDDADAVTLARYNDNEAVACARKVLPNGAISIFTGVPFNESSVWARFFAEAGCHRCSKVGFYVRRNSRYLMAFSGKNGIQDPDWPILAGKLDQSGTLELDFGRRVCTARDIFTGETVVTNADRVVLQSDEPHTWVLELK